MPVVPTGDSAYVYFLLRTNSAVDSFYFARLNFKAAGTVELSLRKRTPTETLLATYGTTPAHVAGNAWKVRVRVEGSALSAKVWKSTVTEPVGWQITATDTALPSPGGVGLRSLLGSALTNTLPVVVAFDDVSVTDSQALTVDRSLNGVVKTQAVGAAVNIATPPITSL
jgi:hypothetical protein